MGSVRPMRMRHVGNTALDTTGDKVSVNRGIGQYVRLSNLDPTNDLEVSFDNGRNFYSVGPADPPLEVNALFHFFLVRASAATIAYVGLVGEG